MKPSFFIAALLLLPGLASAAAIVAPPGYVVEDIPTPPGIPFEVGGMALAPDGSLYVCTRPGDVWRLAGGKWTLFARGLQEPLGVWIDQDDGRIFVGQRSEITELVDEHHTGVADLYKRAGSGWALSGNYHEYAFGPVRDRQGNFYMTLNLAYANGGAVMRSMMGRPVPWRGWAVEIAEGKFVPFASGLRSPSGIAVHKDDLFFTDNQGDWIGVSTFQHLLKGRFYGHPSSLADDPKFAGRDLDKVPVAEYARLCTPPVFWFPYDELAHAPGEPLFDETGGGFGPFGGQVFTGDQTRCNLTRAAIEKVDGEYQGAVFDFIEGFKSGLIRGVFDRDHSLIVAGQDHGWGTKGGGAFCLNRVRWDGRTTPFEIRSINLLPGGFRLHFTKPVQRDAAASPGSYKLQHWHYDYSSKYGSDEMGKTPLTVRSASVAPDGTSVDLQLPLQTGEVYEIDAASVKSAAGESLTNHTGWYTLNRLQTATPKDQ
jgi:hypothetical protein